MTAGKINKIIAASICIIMLVIYLMTAAPTLSFWDCGEFITCSYIMGIPYPPGSPMLSLIGRVMSLIPFYDFRGQGIGEIAYRVNMIDVILGALTVMLTYLVMVKLIRKLRPPTGSRLEDAVTMFCAVVTAFMVAFADEFWTNAVETETYMPSLFMQMLALWLTLRWYERKDEPSAVRYLFLAAYIIGLGNGVHLMVLLIAPTVFLIVLFAKPGWFAHKKLWVYLILFMGAAALIKLYAGLGILYFLMALFALLAPFVLYKLHLSGGKLWKMTLLGMILCGDLYIIGYSVYPTVIIRAFKKPAINEGNPDNWRRYKLYMTRDQYGQENMYKGMFTRKADFSYQFGYMYLRYLIQQFPQWGPAVKVTFENDRSPDQPEPVLISKDVYVSVLLLSLLLYGFYTHGREDWKSLVALLLFFIASSISLALYLNMDNPQVRERSYFFLGSFQIIMVWIGMGVWGLITDINDWFRSKNKPRIVLPATLALFLVFGTLPTTAAFSRHIDPDFTNFQVHDRTYDWIPWDYAHNILESCEKDAILFTNGDNDTFPLWYLQEVEGIRKDIRIVNLSLLNTDWYILQLKNEGVTIPMKYSDEFVEKSLCSRDDKDIARRIWPVEGKDVTVAGITWKLPNHHRLPLLSGEILGMIRIQDVMVANIIQWVNWTRPIYFAVTVANENKIGLEDYLSMEGMVYRLGQRRAQPGEIMVNIPVMHRNVFEKYQYRSLDEPTIYKPPNTLKLVTNYFIGFAQLSERYAMMGDRENTVRAAWGAIKKTPNDLRKRVILYKIFASVKMNEAVDEFLEWEMTSTDFMNDRVNTIEDRLQFYALLNIIGKFQRADSLIQVEHERVKTSGDFLSSLRFGTMLLRYNLDSQAYRFFKELVAEKPHNVEAWKAYAAALYSIGYYKQALDAVNKIMELAPADRSARETRDILLKQIQEKTARDSTQHQPE